MRQTGDLLCYFGEVEEGLGFGTLGHTLYFFYFCFFLPAVVITTPTYTLYALQIHRDIYLPYSPCYHLPPTPTGRRKNRRRVVTSLGFGDGSLPCAFIWGLRLVFAFPCHALYPLPFPLPHPTPFPLPFTPTPFLPFPTSPTSGGRTATGGQGQGRDGDETDGQGRGRTTGAARVGNTLPWLAPPFSPFSPCIYYKRAGACMPARIGCTFLLYLISHHFPYSSQPFLLILLCYLFSFTYPLCRGEHVFCMPLHVWYALLRHYFVCLACLPPVALCM